MNTAMKKTITHWGYLLPYTHIPRNEPEYEKLLNFVDELMKVSRHKKDERVTRACRQLGRVYFGQCRARIQMRSATMIN
jgi:hypothetical protein